jgi:cell fate (sporulation/competence/biofilm development) regulator YlbF (YheA/YmcA/DUF963 family)
MDIELNNKINELLDLLDKSDTIKKIDTYKQKIDSDINLKKLIEDFNLAKQEYYINPNCETKEQLMNKKLMLYNHELIKEYKLAENELNYIVLRFNSKLNTLLNYKNCKKNHKE